MQIVGNCPECGYFINDIDVVCPYCGKELYIDNKDKEPVIETELEKFNWGALFGGWIWGVCHKVWWSLFIIPLSLIPHLGIVFNIIFSLILGFNGNKLAWKNKKWESIEQFNEVQRRWVIISIVISVFYGLFIVLLSSFLILILNLLKNVF